MNGFLIVILSVHLLIQNALTSPLHFIFINLYTLMHTESAYIFYLTSFSKINCSSKSFFNIFPVEFLDNSLLTFILAGRLILASLLRQNSVTASEDNGLSGFLATIIAIISSPHSKLGTPITATSLISECASRTSSISAGDIFSPPLIIMSELRPPKNK